MRFGTYDQKHGYRIIEDFDTVLEKLKISYDYMKERVQDMESTLANWNKDDELQKLRNSNEWLHQHSLLTISDKEKDSLRAFRDKHYEMCCGNGKYKSKGNTWIYTISGTGIGHIIKITCPECGQTEDVTDIDSW